MMKGIRLCVLAGALVLTGCKEEALLSGLDQNQANEVVALLQKNNVQAVKMDMVKAGYSVTVSQADFATAVDLITVHHLPSKPRVEVAQMFPADSLISSPRAEVARIYSAIEQRLEQTLNLMRGVVASSVHVSYDMNNTDAEKSRQPVHISVLLRFQDEGISEASLIADSKRLLKNTFSNVSYDDISVVLTPAPPVLLQAPVKAQSKSYTGIMWGTLIGIFMAGLIAGVVVLIRKPDSKRALRARLRRKPQ